MNQRIRALAEQATTKVEYYPPSRNGYPEYRYDFDREKFAELIVRECVNVALEQKKWVEDQEVFNPHDESWNRARIQQSQRIVDRINEHFGVEQ